MLLTEFSPHSTTLYVSDERVHCAACMLIPVRYYLRGQRLKSLALRLEVKKSFGNAVGIVRLGCGIRFLVVLVFVRAFGSWAQPRLLFEDYGALQLAVYSIFASF